MIAVATSPCRCSNLAQTVQEHGFTLPVPEITAYNVSSTQISRSCGCNLRHRGLRLERQLREHRWRWMAGLWSLISRKALVKKPQMNCCGVRSAIG